MSGGAADKLAVNEGIGAHFLKATPPFAALMVASRIMRRIRCRLATLRWKLAGVQIGPGSVIEYGVTIEAPRYVKIGSNCAIQFGARLTVELVGAWLVLEDGVKINRDAVLDYSGGITLRRKSLVSEAAILSTHSHGYDPRSVPEPHPLEVGEGAWVGMESMIMPGAGRIGAGSLVAARAVVTKPVEDCVIVAGMPAKVVKTLRPGQTTGAKE